MARQRPPIPCTLPFTYWVFGRPISQQAQDGKKPAALPRWRATVEAALLEAIEAASGRRGFVPFEGFVEVQVYWLSLDPSDRSQPDLDNVLKPLIDAFNTRVIADDGQVHRILAEKASINDPPAAVRDVMDEVQDDPLYMRTGEVTIVRLLDLTREASA
ncbi:RusA family crossover junction endodeoxyribonuclease [Methylorubrum sp. SB2]|uniref:RusA family crossover junction endodeoxyribonuclease n=1 Tax=Methylorubrum subtropicum TaxID=3138812 RepID=UPI00313E624E